MGDIIRAFAVRSSPSETPRLMRFYFDSGSPFTFVRKSASVPFRAVLPLPEPETFGGLGEGSFTADAILHIEVELLGFWCRHTAYIVGDSVLDPDYDALVGHDFMQKYNIRLAPKDHDVVLDLPSLRLAQTVRRALALGAAAGS